MMKKLKGKAARFFAAFLFMMMLGLGIQSSCVWAASSSIELGSASYTAAVGTEMKVGVYIRSDEVPGNYHVELTYDSSRLEYVSGGDSESDGVITIEGTAAGTEVKYMLHFNPISGGSAGIFVSDAEVYRQDGQTLMDITQMAKAPITISGTDTTNGNAFSFETKEEETTSEETTASDDAQLINDVPVIGTAVDNNGENLYIVDLSSYVPAEAAWSYSLIEGDFGGKTVTFLTDTDENVRLFYLMNEDGDFSLYACGDDEILYPCGINGGYFYVSSFATLSWPDGLTEDYVDEHSVIYAINQDGEGAFYRTDSGKLRPWDEEESTETEGTETESTEPATEESASLQAETETEEAAPAAVSNKKEMSLSTIIYIFIAIVCILLLLVIFIPIIRFFVRRSKAKKYVKQLPEESEWALRETRGKEKPYEKSSGKKASGKKASSSGTKKTSDGKKSSASKESAADQTIVEELTEETDEIPAFSASAEKPAAEADMVKPTTDGTNKAAEKEMKQEAEKNLKQEAEKATEQESEKAGKVPEEKAEKELKQESGKAPEEKAEKEPKQESGKAPEEKAETKAEKEIPAQPVKKPLPEMFETLDFEIDADPVPDEETFDLADDDNFLEDLSERLAKILNEEDED